MDISYRLNNNQIEKLKKYKNPSIWIKKENFLKNGKYKIHLTVGMFNKLIKDGVLKYVFTDKRKNYYLQQGGSLASLFQSILPYGASFANKLIPSLRVAATVVSHIYTYYRAQNILNFVQQLQKLIL